MHFSLHCLEVQSAYTSAAGSEVARKPTSNGGFESFFTSSAISACRDLAMVPASITLQCACCGSFDDMVRCYRGDRPHSLAEVIW